MLKLHNVSSVISGYRAISGVSLEIKQGEFVALIGANGAGKSTLFRTIAGVLHPVEGTIEFKGKRIDRMPPHEVVKLGLSLCPEGRKLFPHLSVQKNLMLGGYTRRRNRQLIQKRLDQVYEIFPILKERKNQPAGTFSGGEQQMLAIARSLMANPELLLLDEPSLGLAPFMVQKVAEILKIINEEMGTSVFLSEQNANMALNITSRGYVLENGEIVMEDTSDRLKADENVRKAYLGA